MRALIKYLPTKENSSTFYYTKDGHRIFCAYNDIREKKQLDGKIENVKPYAVIENIEMKIKGKWKGYKYVVEIKDDEVLCSNMFNDGDIKYDDKWYKIGDLPVENFIVLGEASSDAVFIENGKTYAVDKEVYFTGTGRKADSHEMQVLDTLGYPYEIIYRIECPTCKHYH